MAKTHVKAGDKVEITTGKFKGTQGIVLSVNAKKEQVIVEGGRQITKAIRRSEQNPEGGLEKIDGPVHISNVKKVS